MEERTSAGKNSNRYSGFGQGKHEKEGGIQVRGNQWGGRTGAEASGGLKRKRMFLHLSVGRAYDIVYWIQAQTAPHPDRPTWSVPNPKLTSPVNTNERKQKLQ